MKDKITIFLGGMLAGMLILMVIDQIPGSTAYKATVAIKSCEKDLPRTQSCILTAVPKEEEL